jgi:hypothetical protein
MHHTGKAPIIHLEEYAAAVLTLAASYKLESFYS